MSLLQASTSRSLDKLPQLSRTLVSLEINSRQSSVNTAAGGVGGTTTTTTT